MATWVRCTRARDGEAVLLNLDSALSLEREMRNGTLIIFPSYSVYVKDSPNSILKRAGIEYA